MARLPRLVIPQQAHYVIQRGLDSQALFRDADDHRAMLAWLREGSRKFKVAIHAYALLPHAWCFLATPADDTGLGRMMQWIGRYYVPYFNQKYGRAGTLWQGRFKATVIDAQHYLVPCIRYIETSQVEDSGVRAADFPWSSYAHHIGQQQDGLIVEHGLYWTLGNTPFDREVAYRQLVLSPLSMAEVKELDAAFSKSWVLGPEKFRHDMEKLAGRRVTPATRGRPMKERPGPTKEQKQGKVAKSALD